MIRPIDLQTTILSQNAPAAVQRAEEGPRIAAQAAQAAFAAELVQRDESVAAAADVVGNRVDAEAKQRERDGAHKRKPRTPFEQVVDEAAGSSDEQPHIVDFSA